MKKKVDTRLTFLLQYAVRHNERALVVMVGDRGRYQAVNLHFMLARSMTEGKPKVLWCYKNELQFSSHQKKRMKEVKQLQLSGLYDEKVDDPFDLFVSSADIHYVYYHESHKVLGNTFNMIILQDFQALTPNLLCRTIETVQGGGIILMLLNTMTSLKQLHCLAMDVHDRYRTYAHSDLQPRFNERFLLSLARNKNCIVLDDQLNVLPLAEQSLEQGKQVLKRIESELSKLKTQMESKGMVGRMVQYARTLDQAKVIMGLYEGLGDGGRSVVCVTAGRGRGKSAALGLGVAGALRMGYNNIFVTAPSPQNLKTFFEFVVMGLNALQGEQKYSVEKKYSTSAEYEKAILKIDVREPQVESRLPTNRFVQYVFPNDVEKMGHCDLMIIDEAAAIPLPYVRCFLSSPTVFMASTINGYEGTGRSLSLKLIEEMRIKNARGHEGYRKLRELSMTDPIRYALNDEIERWLNELLLLNATEVVPLKGERLPHPSECELYLVNRDTLFSYKASSERFLFSLMSLFISSHYKNSPNDLQLIADSPSQLLFVLLGPLTCNEGKAEMPDVLCTVQMALEGNLSEALVVGSAHRGIKPSGDMIPWTMREQFQDAQFPQMAGARVVRIATHAKAQKMGYGSRALQLMSDFFEGKLLSMDAENIVDLDFQGEGVRKPLLRRLEEVRPLKLQYVGTSFGFTQPLIKFWRKNGYEPVYLRQTVNDVTSEHSGIMLKRLNQQLHIEEYTMDFRRRFISLLGYQFRSLEVSIALEVLGVQNNGVLMERRQLEQFITVKDYVRLKSYTKNQVDFHLILDLLPALSRLYFLGLLGPIHMGFLNQALLIGIGLQMKPIQAVCKDLKDIDVRNALPLFQKTLIKITKAIQGIFQKETIEKMPKGPNVEPQGTAHKRTADFGAEENAKIFEMGTGHEEMGAPKKKIKKH